MVKMKHRKALLSVLLLFGVLAILVLTTLEPISSEHHKAYSHQSLPIKNAINFNLGGGKRYFDMLNRDGENLLIFWGSWCPHCESLLDQIVKADDYETIAKNLFTVSEDTLISDVENHRGEFPIYLDQDKSVYNAYGLEHVPTVLVIDGQGRVIGSSEGEQASLDLIKEYVSNNS